MTTHNFCRPCLRSIVLTYAFCGLLLPTPGNANLHGYNVSLFGGPGFELNLRDQTVPIYGFTGSYAFENSLEIGGEIAMRGNIGTVGFDLNYLLKNSVFVGIQTGLDFASPVTYYLGPQVGFDYLIQPQISIGTEIQYLYTFHDRGGIFETLFALKYYLDAAPHSAHPL